MTDARGSLDEPAPGFTGGIAVYGGQKRHAGSPHSAGYVWLDVEAGEGPARYRLKGFTSEVYEDTTTAALDAAASGVAHELGGAILHVVTWPDQVSGLELWPGPRLRLARPSWGRRTCWWRIQPQKVWA